MSDNLRVRKYEPGLVSVIVPVFNGGKYITESLNSLATQSYKKWECIIVDDGSTDDSLSLARIWAKVQPRAVVLTQENQGVKKLASTLNRAFSKCSGEFVTMLPADDVWSRRRLELQIPMFDDPEVAMVHARLGLIDSNSRWLREAFSIKKTKLVTASRQAFITELLCRNIIQQPTVLIRAENLHEIKGYLQHRYMYAEDYPTQLEVSLTGKTLFLDHVVAYYRVHSGQMTANHGLKMIASDRLFINRKLRDNERRLLEVIGPKKNWIEEVLIRRNFFDYKKMFKMQLKQKNLIPAIYWFFRAFEYQFRVCISRVCKK